MKTKTTWDVELLHQYQKAWLCFRKRVIALNKIKRHIFNEGVSIKSPAHTFGNASERTYGAAIYLQAILKNEVVTTRIFCAKSKIFPFKLQSLSHLELWAALLGD